MNLSVFSFVSLTALLLWSVPVQAHLEPPLTGRAIDVEVRITGIQSQQDIDDGCQPFDCDDDSEFGLDFTVNNVGHDSESQDEKGITDSYDWDGNYSYKSGRKHLQGTDVLIYSHTQCEGPVAIAVVVHNVYEDDPISDDDLGSTSAALAFAPSAARITTVESPETVGGENDDGKIYSVILEFTLKVTAHDSPDCKVMPCPQNQVREPVSGVCICPPTHGQSPDGSCHLFPAYTGGPPCPPHMHRELHTGDCVIDAPLAICAEGSHYNPEWNLTNSPCVDDNCTPEVKAAFETHVAPTLGVVFPEEEVVSDACEKVCPENPFFDLPSDSPEDAETCPEKVADQPTHGVDDVPTLVSCGINALTTLEVLDLPFASVDCLDDFAECANEGLKSPFLQPVGGIVESPSNNLLNLDPSETSDCPVEEG